MNKGNCFLFALYFKYKFGGSIRFTFRNRHKILPSFFVIKDGLRYGYRSSPRGNGNKLWFKGRIQITKLRQSNKQ